MTPERWARLRAKTNDQVLAEARGDPTALPVEDRGGPYWTGCPRFAGEAYSLGAAHVANRVCQDLSHPTRDAA